MRNGVLCSRCVQDQMIRVWQMFRLVNRWSVILIAAKIALHVSAIITSNWIELSHITDWIKRQRNTWTKLPFRKTLGLKITHIGNKSQKMKGLFCTNYTGSVENGWESLLDRSTGSGNCTIKDTRLQEDNSCDIIPQEPNWAKLREKFFKTFPPLVKCEKHNQGCEPGQILNPPLENGAIMVFKQQNQYCNVLMLGKQRLWATEIRWRWEHRNVQLVGVHQRSEKRLRGKRCRERMFR